MRYLLLYLLCLSASLRAQVYRFQQVYGSANSINLEGTALLTLPTGDLILTCNRSNNSTVNQGLLVKMNSQGIVQWCKNFSDGGRQRFYAVDTLRTGGLIAAGSYYNGTNTPNPNYQCLIVKTDNSGSLLWSRVISSSYRAEIYAIHECANGDLIAAGMANDSVSGPKIMMLRTDASGNLLWANRYGSVLYGKEFGWDVIETPDSCFMAVGNSATIGAGAEDVFVIKADAAGNVVWAKSYGGTLSDGGQAIIRMKNENNFLVLGSSKSFSTGANEFYLLKIDLNGNLLWSRTYSSSGLSLTGVSLLEGPGKELDLFGNSGVGPPQDYLLIRTDSAGAVLWAKKYDASASDFAYKIMPAAYNGLVMLGRCALPVQHVYLVKTDANGNSGCNESVMIVTSSIPPTQLDSGAAAFPFGVVSTPALLKNDVVLSDSVICSSLGEQEMEVTDELLIYPNPGSGIFTIQAGLPEFSLEVYDLQGRLIGALRNQTRVDLSGQSKGVYLVRLTSEKFTVVRKVVVE